jgi:hypothetical protein
MEPLMMFPSEKLKFSLAALFLQNNFIVSKQQLLGAHVAYL